MGEALAIRNMAAVIKIYRQRTGASQTQIAAACEIPQSHVSEIESSGRQVSKLELFERFADGLRIPGARLGLAERAWEVGPTGKPAPRTVAPAEVVRVYPNRGAVPGGLWRSLLERAEHIVDILVIAGLFLPDGQADLVPLLRGKGERGTKIRYALGNPDSAAVALRGAEEGIGDGLAARTRLSLTYLAGLRDAPGVEVGLHETALYNSLYRFDGDLLVNAHVYGAPAAHSPVIHLRQAPGAALFDHYTASFEKVWATTEGAF
jgi:transcriptional regulator with XRE-family HTH domain